MSATLRIDTTEFSAAMKEYMRHTERDLAEVLNQKSYSIAMASNYFTHRAGAADIRASLEATGNNGAPMWINAVRARRNSKGLPSFMKRDELAAQKEKFIRNMLAHRKFLSAGWLAATAIFARKIGKPVKENAAMWEAADIGGGKLAMPGKRPLAGFYNQASSKISPESAGAERMAAQGLLDAINQELARMDAHLANKLQGTANKYATKFFR